MAVEIRPFTVTIPAGTTIASGFTASMQFPARIVTQIDVRIPPGPRGEVGFGIGTGGIIVVPYGGTDFIVTDDQYLSFPVENTLESGAWELLGYNTGAYDHTLRVYFHCQLVVTAAPTAAGGPLPPGTLGSGGGTGAPAPTPPPVPPPAPVPPPPPLPPPPLPPPPPTGGGGVPSPPVLLPPSTPVYGQIPAVPEVLMIGVAGIGQVWLLGEDVYVQVMSQDDADALAGAGIAGAAVSTEQHQALLSASANVIRVRFADDILSGLLGITRG